MSFKNMVLKSLRGLHPAAGSFWAGTEGIGRGRGRRLAYPKVRASGPTSRDIEMAVNEGRIIEVGS